MQKSPETGREIRSPHEGLTVESLSTKMEQLRSAYKEAGRHVDQATLYKLAGYRFVGTTILSAKIASDYLPFFGEIINYFGYKIDILASSGDYYLQDQNPTLVSEGFTYIQAYSPTLKAADLQDKNKREKLHHDTIHLQEVFNSLSNEPYGPEDDTEEIDEIEGHAIFVDNNPIH